MEYTDEEASFEIAKLRKLEQANIEAVSGCSLRSSAWREVERQKQQILNAIRSDIDRVKAGNVWKTAFHTWSTDSLDRAMLELQEFINTTMQERNITEEEYDKGRHLIYAVKINALRIVRDLDEEKINVRRELREKKVEN